MSVDRLLILASFGVALACAELPPAQVSCVDARTIELRDPSGGWPGDGFSAQFRNTGSMPFRVGDTVKTVDFVASVVEVDEGRAIAARFRFRAKLDHESFVWTAWDSDEFVATSAKEWCGRSSG